MYYTEQDMLNCLQVLHAGGILQFSTEYGCCLGCDATQEKAVDALRGYLPKSAASTFPVLLAEERDVLQWVAAADLLVFDFAVEQPKPTAILFEHGLGFASNLPAPDGSVLIFLTRDAFCRHLVKRFRKPIVAAPFDPKGFQNAQPEQTSVELPIMQSPVTRQEVLHSAMPHNLQVLYWNKGNPVVEEYL
ncbi:L-threonylcarbamoyladenylate synthase [Cnuella takakiae]|uniref:L-threonylcarbamoyladenylate synthase n=2 Tax=Cnuella takakiae TaxID=1302690 RepID=A0A1M4YCK8_9BACT|nr:hypothetical protein BUE76_15345 [Cnuella takakiae]SHF03561.1 L-threonylcarbamoyladenylate synthase [Cnuella takakiae]